jgi:WD40 repeat protein
MEESSKPKRRWWQFWKPSETPTKAEPRNQQVRMLKQWNVEEMEVAVAISRNGRVALAVSGTGKSIDCLEVPNGERTRRLEGHETNVRALAIGPDGQKAASGAEDGEVRLWDLSTGKLIAILKGHSQRISSIEFSPDGNFMLSGSWDHTCRLWNVRTLQCLSTLQGHSDSVTGVSIAPDNRTAASSSFDRRLRVWEMATGKCIGELPGHESKVICVSISRSGNRLVAGDLEGYLSVSDLPATRLKVVGPFSAPVCCVKLSADGAKAFVGLSGGALWTFDLQTQRAIELFQLTGRVPAQLPFGLEFAVSDDARYMVAARAASAAIFELQP